MRCENRCRRHTPPKMTTDALGLNSNNTRRILSEPTAALAYCNTDVLFFFTPCLPIQVAEAITRSKIIKNSVCAVMRSAQLYKHGVATFAGIMNF